MVLVQMSLCFAVSKLQAVGQVEESTLHNLRAIKPKVAKVPDFYQSDRCRSAGCFGHVGHSPIARRLISAAQG
jgi:hypothetical protein